jgi:hypothetical protein
MVVVPTDEHVELHYGWTPVDLLAWLLTLGGIVGLVLLARRPPVEVPVEPVREVVEPADDRPHPEEVDDEGDPVPLVPVGAPD